MSATQSEVNANVWRRGRHVRGYDSRFLYPDEVQLLVRYRAHLSGRVLDLGCGAGRLLAYLVMLGADTYGLDISPAMVARSRANIPDATVVQGDLATLRDHVEGRFATVLAVASLLDVFNDAERRQVFGQIRSILEPDGLLIFSSHNLAYLDNPPPGRQDEQRVTLEKFLNCSVTEIAHGFSGRLMSARNRRRLGPLQERHADYAIVNDFSHHYSLLHYYIRRDDQERQLDELGFELLECLDSDGRTVPPGTAGSTGALNYVARPIQ